MDRNKSIDGLVVRRSHTATSSTRATKPKSSRTTKTTKSTKPVKSTKSPKPTKPTAAPPKSIKAQSIESQTTPLPRISTEPLASADDFLTSTQTFDFDGTTGELHATTSSTAPDSEPKPTKKSKSKPSKKRKIIRRVIIIVFSLILIAVICFAIWGNDIIAKITGGQGNIFDLFSIMDDHYEPLKTDVNGRTNILAFGTSGYNMDGDEDGGTHDGAQLTDSIMIISLDQESGDLAMISLPRDLKASPTCTATGKINEIFWCNNMDNNNEQAGAEALMAEVSDILDIDIQYYAHLNWGSLVQIVDTLGGITVTLDEDIEDYYYTGIVFEAGVPYDIDGIHAVALARARHGTANGDFSRGASQQKILLGIRDKALSKGLSLTDLLNLANTLGDNLRTNFSVDEIKTVAHLATNLDLNSVRQISLLEPEPLVTTGTINGISYVLPIGGAGYYTPIQKFIARMLSNDPRDRENASILVLNGTDTPGLASSEQLTLEEEGYSNIYIDDAPEDVYELPYTLYVLDDTTPGTQKLLEEKYSTTSKSYDELSPAISQDYNFVLIIGESTNTNESE